MDATATQESVEERIAAAFGDDETIEEVQEVVEEVELEAEEPEGETDETQETELEEDTDGIELEAAEVAAILGLDEQSLSINDDGEVQIKVKVDGEISTVPLKDMQKSYQLDSHVNKRSMELAEQRKAFEQAAKDKAAQLNNQLQQTEALVNVAQQNLMQEFQSIDWNELESIDPGRYAAERQKFAERNAQIEQIKTHAGQIGMAQQQQASEEWKAARQQRLQHEKVMLLDTVPEWSDHKTMATESESIKKMMGNIGFTPEETASMDDAGFYDDHRIVRILRDAMLYRKQKSSVEPAKKKVKNLRKVLKPGAPTSKQVKAEHASKAKLQKLRKGGGRVSDAASLLVDRM